MYEKLTEFLENKAENRNAQEELSKVFNFTQATASRKLNGLLDFKSAEMRYFRRYYDLESKDITILFEL